VGVDKRRKIESLGIGGKREREESGAGAHRGAYRGWCKGIPGI